MRQPRSALRRAVSLFAAVALVTTLITAGIPPVIALTVNALAAAPAAPALPAPTTVPASTQFDITGFLQSATVDTPADPHSGGTLMLNGHLVIVPRETIVILPASALTWQELFAQAVPPYGLAAVPPSTGMALADLPKPLTTYEFQAVGNRVKDANGTNGCTVAAGCDRYIAGLIHVSQQDLNSGAGYINFMDYDLGEMRVGGIYPDPNCAASPANTVAGGLLCSGARVRINDPANATTTPPGSGRYSRAMTPDGRFMVDQDNPTIASATGYPMCFPRTDPATTADAQCPQANRPVYDGATDISGIVPAVLPPAGEFYTLFRMAGLPPSSDTRALAAGVMDPRFQAPMEVGDFVNFAGTLIDDSLANGLNASYISAHTINNNVAIFTWPGTNPAYITIEVGLIGTGGLTVFGAGEAAIRTRFEGMTTDETRGIHLYGIDVTPVTGVTTDRDFGTIMPDPGPPNGAVRGRWRFRPPCAAFGTVPAKPDKQCVMNAAGTFLPPPREVRAVIEGLQVQNPANTACGLLTNIPTVPVGQNCAETAANGIFYGQYHAPIGEYIFPENIPGNPIVENNFNTLDFLAKGGYSSFTGVVAGVLNPWPSNILPAGLCQAPVANAGGPYTVAFNGTISLSATSAGTAPFSYLWVAPLVGTLSSLTIPNPVYNAAGVAAGTVVNLSVTVSNACGTATSTASTTVTVGTATAPTVNHVAPTTVRAGLPGSITITGSDPNVPPLLPLTFTVTQSGVPALGNFTVTQGPNPPGTSAVVAFTTALGGATTINLTITATNSAGLVSLPEFAVVNVVDNPTLTSSEYRIGKQRLVLTANSDSPTAILTLRPYACNSSAPTLCPLVGGIPTYTPAPGAAVFTNAGAGIWNLTLVGAPAPLCQSLNGPFTPTTVCNKNVLFVSSNLGGISPANPQSILQKIRN